MSRGHARAIGALLSTGDHGRRHNAALLLHDESALIGAVHEAKLAAARDNMAVHERGQRGQDYTRGTGPHGIWYTASRGKGGTRPPHRAARADAGRAKGTPPRQ